MELLQLKNRALEIFHVDDVAKLPEALMSCVVDGDASALDAFLTATGGDISRDWMQTIYQYYFADRDGLKQDFTPPSLARMVSALVGGDGVCVDMCAGSGALSLPWSLNRPEATLWLKEFDEGVIPFLLFNLCLRNVEGYVEHCDVLSGEAFKAWHVQRGERFAACSSCEPVKLDADVCVSNPPFNIRWEAPPFAQIYPCYAQTMLPPASNANFAFVLNAIEAARRSALILPCGVMSAAGVEAQIRQSLVERNLLDAVIACPPKMFEGTDIPVCILVFDREKTDARISVVDMREQCQQEERDQRGQYGGASHTGRTYHKTINVFTADHINTACEAVKGRLETLGLCASVTAEDVRAKEYNLTPSRYISQETIEHKHRPFEDIVADINRVVKSKNACKLTINETLARKLGLDVELFRSDAQQTLEPVNELLASLQCEAIIEHNYVSFTKEKNVLRMENGSKEMLGDVFMTAFPLWKNHIMYLNNEENRLLAELRDALLPGMMDGSIELPEKPVAA